jgi:threonyl-tRNA synthetase
MAVVGDREQDAGEIALREHRKGDEGSFPVTAFIERLAGEVKARRAR